MQDTVSTAAAMPQATPRTQRPLKTPRELLGRFEIEADLCPHVLLRILGLMSRDGSIPVTVAVTRLPDAIQIAIDLDCAPWTRCEKLVIRIEELPMVRKAAVSPCDRLGDKSRNERSDPA